MNVAAAKSRARDLAAYPAIYDAARDYATNIGSGTLASMMDRASRYLQHELRDVCGIRVSLPVCREIVMIAAPDHVAAFAEVSA